MKSLAFCVLLFAIFLGGCQSGTPQQKLLDKAASALDGKNPAEFLDCIDLSAYAANQVRNLTNNDAVLGTLNKWSNQLGVGRLDNIIDNVMDVGGKIRQELTEGVASGQIMAQCARALTPDCPWSPSALKNAKIVDLSQDAAIAQVTTPANITSWLAMRKIDGAWKIVGRAPMESAARKFATTDPDAAGN